MSRSNRECKSAPRLNKIFPSSKLKLADTASGMLTPDIQLFANMKSGLGHCAGSHLRLTLKYITALQTNVHNVTLKCLMCSIYFSLHCQARRPAALGFRLGFVPSRLTRHIQRNSSSLETPGADAKKLRTMPMDHEPGTPSYSLIPQRPIHLSQMEVLSRSRNQMSWDSLPPSGLGPSTSGYAHRSCLGLKV